jgi:hypothetical protein
MRQQPHRTGRRALAAFGIWRRVVEIAIDVENMNVLSRNTRECLSRSHHDAAIATDQQRDLPGLLQVWLDAIAHAFPGDPRAGPTPDRRDRVMGKIAGNRNVAVIDRSAAGRLQARQKLHIAISLSVVLVTRIQ